MLLMMPGPIEVDPRVIAAMNRPAVNPHSSEHMELVRELFEGLRTIFHTESWVTVLPGSGRTGLEAAICSAVEPGDRTVHLVNGSFGELMVEISGRAGGQVAVVEGRWGGALDLEAVERSIRRTRPKIVTMVHSETSTGAVYELSEVARISHQYGALFVVDAISSIGTTRFLMDKAGVDFAVAASNKGLGALHGLSMVAVSSHAADAMGQRKTPCQSYSLDLKRWDEMYFRAEAGQRRSANPPPTHLVFALLEACRIALEEGLPARWSRCHEFARATRNAVEAAGLQIFPDRPLAADCVTAFEVPPGVDANLILEDMKARGVMIAGSVMRPSPVTGRLLRISQQGIQASEIMLIPTLAALERSLRKFGYSVRPGTMVSAFEANLEQ